MTPLREPSALEKRVLLLAPTGKDASLATTVLEKVRIHCAITTAKELAREIAAGAGAVIFTEETITSGESRALVSALADQPAWSDLPVILLTFGGANSAAAARAMEMFGNVILLERPVRVNTLVSAARTALRARRKQYQIRDHITFRERMNQELERKVAERTAALTASNKELESFCYTVAHDLRTPLRSIHSFTQLLQMRLDQKAEPLSDEERDFFARIGSASGRMARLIDDLLNLSRLTRREMREEVVDLGELAAEVVAELRKAHPDRAVRARIAAGIRAMGDPHLLRLVLQNLLENAWKFTGRTPRASIEFGLAYASGDTACFVRDNGAGFDMAYSGKLFGVFQRLHREDEFPGNGIGLATAQRIIERHQGRIWAESAPGRGATFYFSLPTLTPAPAKTRAAEKVLVHGR